MALVVDENGGRKLICWRQYGH